MFLRIFSFLLFTCTVFCIDFPGRLSAEESAHLRKTCGRSPVTLGLHVQPLPQKKSFGSHLTNRTLAPWVTSTGVLISKRHILTCAHCVHYLQLASQSDRFATIAMTCVGSNSFNECNEEPMQTIKIKEVIYSDIYNTGSHMKIEADIAVLTLEKDIETSELIYPVCLAGYAINESEPIVNFGYGYSSSEELTEGKDQYNFLQTFTAKRSNDTISYFRRDYIFTHGTEPVGAHTQSGDSGSGFIHTKNGIISLYAVVSRGADIPPLDYLNRVSPHLNWINYVTGIEVKDEDMEFSGYFYPIRFTDKRIKKKFSAGASHPSRTNYN